MFLILFLSHSSLVLAYGNGKANDDIAYDSDDDMPSYDYIELTQDNSQHGFTTTHQQHTTASIGGGGGGGGGGVLRTSDLDDDEEYVEHSDID